MAARSVDPILLNDYLALHELLAETLANHPDVIFAFIIDPHGQILAHTFEGGFPTALHSQNEFGLDPEASYQRYFSNQGRIHDFAAPIFEGKAGRVRLGVSEERLQDTINLLLNQEGDSADPPEKTKELRQIASETLDEVRLLSRELRPSVLDDLGLAAALERYTVEISSRYPNLMVDLHCNLPVRLVFPVETALYRIVQEAMTNAARHSRAKTLSVLLTTRNGRAQAIIEDDGCGFDPVAVRRSGNSVGLHSMAERAEQLGGTIEIESSPKGTAIFVEAPV